MTIKPTNGHLYATAFFSTWRSVLTSITAAYSVAKVAIVERLDCMAYGPRCLRDLLEMGTSGLTSG